LKYNSDQTQPAVVIVIMKIFLTATVPQSAELISRTNV